jgi:hypothetical protein
MIGADKEKAVAAIQKRLSVELDAAIELANRAEESFLSETGRRFVPEKAFWLWIDLAAAVRAQDMEAGGASGGQASGRIASIKRGDTTIQYDHSSAAATLDLPSSLINRVRVWRVGRAQ